MIAVGIESRKKTLTPRASVNSVFTMESQVFMLFLSLGFLMIAAPGIAFADEVNLTDIFATDAFRGSWDVIQKFNFVGLAMNWIISVFCLIGLFLLLVQKMATILYLSGRVTFDTVHELKNEGKGQKFFGFGAMTKSVYSGNYGTGLDAIIGFLLSLVPDFKEYSDYSEKAMGRSNLTEDDTIGTWAMKTLFPTVLTIFFLSIGFSGTLFKAYGMVVEGLAAAADKIVDTDLGYYVDRTLSNGTSYKYSAESNARGSFKNKVFTNVYGKVLSKSGSLSTEVKQTVGRNIEDKVINKLTASNIKAAVGTTGNSFVGDDNTQNSSEQGLADWGNLEYQVVISTQKIAAKGELSTNGVSSGSESAIALADLFGAEAQDTINGGDQTYYLHLRVSKKSGSGKIYFNVKNSGGTKNKDKDGTGSQLPTQ